MSKELEALNKLKRDLNEHYLSDIAKDTLYQIIETALYEKNNLERKLDEYALALKGKNKQLEALKIIKEHKLLNYVLKNKKCAEMYHLQEDDLKFLEEAFENGNSKD